MVLFEPVSEIGRYFKESKFHFGLIVGAIDLAE
jgi:hypothetical protein